VEVEEISGKGGVDSGEVGDAIGQVWKGLWKAVDALMKVEEAVGRWGRPVW
jgi:hypothetical protein